MLQIVRDRDITTEEALEAYIRADGNIHLTSERLGVPTNELLDVLSQDHVSLQRLLRTRTLLSMYTSFEKAQAVMVQSLPMMDADDAAKTFIGIGNILEKLTANSQNVNLNIHEYMLRMLPPDIRDALTVLTAPTESVLKLSDD